MTSRERVLASFNHESIDRVPVDCNGHRSSGISIQAYKRLRNYLGLKTDKIYMYDVLQQLAIVEDDVLDHFGVDVVQFGYEMYKDAKYWKPWTQHDGNVVMIPKHINIHVNSVGDFEIYDSKGNITCVQKQGCLYFEQTYFPYLSQVNNDDFDFSNLESDLEGVMWCSVSTPPAPFSYTADGMQQLGKKAKTLRNSTERAVYGIFGGNLLELGEQLFRMDNFLMLLAAEPEVVESFLDNLLEMHIKNLNLYLEHVGPYIDIIGFGDDLGMQNGPQMSTVMFEKYFKYRYKKMWDLVKSKMPHLKICLHSCGGIEPLLGHLLDAGLDAVNPVQITCDGMDPQTLKDLYGEKLFFWGGGCDTRHVLSYGSVDEVEKNVKALLGVFKKREGFMFQQVHNMLADVPPENIVAMYDAVQKYGRY